MAFGIDRWVKRGDRKVFARLVGLGWCSSTTALRTRTIRGIHPLTSYVQDTYTVPTFYLSPTYYPRTPHQLWNQALTKPLPTPRTGAQQTDIDVDSTVLSKLPGCRNSCGEPPHSIITMAVRGVTFVLVADF